MPHHENLFCICEHKAQISACVFATYLVKPIHFLNSSVGTLYGYAAHFVSDLVGNPEYRFSHDAAQINDNTHTCMQYL